MDNKTTHILFISLPFVLLILIGALVFIEKKMPKQYQWINYPLFIILFSTIGFYVYVTIMDGRIEDNKHKPTTQGKISI